MITVEARPMLSPEEVAARLCVSVETVRRMLRSKEIPALKVGQQWRIPADFAERMMSGTTEKPA